VHADFATLAVDHSFDLLGTRVTLRPTSELALPDYLDVPIIPDSGQQSLSVGPLELGATGLLAQIRVSDTGNIKPKAWLIIFPDGRHFKVTSARHADKDRARLKWLITGEEVKAP
jgi:hypothetical protein